MGFSDSFRLAAPTELKQRETNNIDVDENI
jgi:hypothetical protein